MSDAATQSDPGLPDTALVVSQSVTALTTQVATLNQRFRRGQLTLRLTIIALIVVAIVGVAAVATSIRIGMIAEQNRAHIQESCVLYEILLSTANPQSRERFPLGPDAYDRAIARLTNSTVALKCPRRSGP